MSVLANKRIVSKAEFVNTANQIYVETLGFLTRMSARYSRLMAEPVAKLAGEVIDHSEKARLPIQNHLQCLADNLLVHFLCLHILDFFLRPPGRVSPCGSVLITLNGDNSKSFLGMIYTIFPRHICVDYAPEYTCYFHHLERICVYRKGKQTNGGQQYENEILPQR